MLTHTGQQGPSKAPIPGCCCEPSCTDGHSARCEAPQRASGCSYFLLNWFGLGRDGAAARLHFPQSIGALFPPPFHPDLSIKVTWAPAFPSPDWLLAIITTHWSNRDQVFMLAINQPLGREGDWWERGKEAAQSSGIKEQQGRISIVSQISPGLTSKKGFARRTGLIPSSPPPHFRTKADWKILQKKQRARASEHGQRVL